MKNTDYSRREQVLVDTANLLYNGNLREVQADIRVHVMDNYGRMGTEKREMFLKDVRILEALIL